VRSGKWPLASLMTSITRSCRFSVSRTCCWKIKHCSMTRKKRAVVWKCCGPRQRTPPALSAGSANSIGQRYRRRISGCRSCQGCSAIRRTDEPKWRGLTQARGITVAVGTEFKAFPIVAGEESALREVLTNLLFNAVDAMPEGGRISIETSIENETAVIRVTDTGTGMTESVRSVASSRFSPLKAIVAPAWDCRWLRNRRAPSRPTGNSILSWQRHHVRYSTATSRRNDC